MISSRTASRLCLGAAILALAVGLYADWPANITYGLTGLFAGIGVVLMMGDLIPDLWRQVRELRKRRR